MRASSPVTDEQLAQLRADGYAVVPSLVPQDFLQRAVGAVEEVLEIRADDPASWSCLGDDFRGIVPIWGHQALWDIRQHPPLVAVWRKVWGVDDLWVSLDRCRFQPPGLVEGVLPIHWDHNPHDMGRAWFQGVVALTDTATDQGAFRCVPELYRDRAAWPATPIVGPYGDEWRPDVTGRGIVQVAARAGDVIVWDSRLPHANSPNRSPRPRWAFYVMYFPTAGVRPYQGERAERLECYETGRCLPVWRSFAGHQRVEPWPPARLTNLGRQLLGAVESAQRP